MPGSVQAEDARIDMDGWFTQKGTGTPGYLHLAWVKKRKNQEQTSVSRATGFSVGNF